MVGVGGENERSGLRKRWVGDSRKDRDISKDSERKLNSRGGMMLAACGGGGFNGSQMCLLEKPWALCLEWTSKKRLSSLQIMSSSTTTFNEGL